MMAIDDSVDAGLSARIRGEFREMPGLSLTIDQACRLWGCDSATCRHVIDMLVAAGEIPWSRDGRLFRALSPDDEALR
jgi:hypothetical protein